MTEPRRAADLWAVVSDVHHPHAHWPTYRAFRAWVEHVRPDRIVVNGDWWDLPSLSSFHLDDDADVEALPGIKAGVRELRHLAAHCGQMDVIEGNHEHRLWKQLIGGVGKFQGHVLRGFKGLTLEEQARFHGLPDAVRWHVETKAWHGLSCGQFLIRHGHRQGGRWGAGKHVAHNMLARSLGQCEIIGHHHRVQLYTHGTHECTAIAVCNGHMQDDVEYQLDPSWARGFTVMMLDRARNVALPLPVLIEGGRFSWVDGTVFDGNAERPVWTPGKGSGLTVDGVTRTLGEWSRLTGISRSVIRRRLARGWDPADAIRQRPASPRPRGADGRFSR